MQGQRSEYILFINTKEEPGSMYMLQVLTVATLLLPPQTTLDVCHKKITERVSDSSSYPCSISHWERWSGLIDCLIPTSSFVQTGTQLNKTSLEIAQWVLAGIHGFVHCVYILAAATIRWWRLFHLELLQLCSYYSIAALIEEIR